MSTTESMQDDNCNGNKDVMSSPPSLAKLLKTDAADNASSKQQHFDSGGGGGGSMDGGQDSWGSISKMLHQRYNSGHSAEAKGERNKFGLCTAAVFGVCPQ